MLTRDGFRVILADHDAAAKVADDIAADVDPAVGRPFPARVDITDAASVADFAGVVEAEFGRADVLVNNAGVEPAMNLESGTTEAWDLTLSVNLRGTMLMAQALLPLRRRQRSGSIVNITSRAHIGGSRNPAYAGSKAGIVGFTLSTAVELGPLGVRSNAVSPSFVRTAFNQQRQDIGDMEAMVAAYSAFTPLRRLIEPEDVANAVAFLASDRARNITGQVLHVTAGSHLPPMT